MSNNHSAQVDTYFSVLPFPGTCVAVSDQIGMEDMGVHPGELLDESGTRYGIYLCIPFMYHSTAVLARAHISRLQSRREYLKRSHSP